MALSIIFGTNVSVAVEQAQAAIQSKEQVYGSQLMTREELARTSCQDAQPENK